MRNNLIKIAAIAAVSLTSFVSVAPAVAHDRNNNGYYQESQRGYYDNQGYFHPVRYDNRGYDNRGYDNRSYDNRNDDYRDNRRDVQYDNGYRRQKCSKGTTGTILGGVIGGLLGREVGRGGYYNRPSTTGLIIGAGAGALAGRALERSGNRC